MLDFPASPITGQQYNAPNGVTYEWVPTPPMWIVNGTFTPPSPTGDGLVDQGYVLADNYGAVKNEVTFNAACLDAKARGLNVMVGPGTWTSTNGGTFVNPGVEVTGAGPALTRFVKVGTGPCFTASGTVPVTTGGSAVVGTVFAGDIVLTVGSGGANFVDGDKCILISDDLMFSDFPGSLRGEFATVQRKVDDGSNIIGLWGAVKMTYTTNVRLIKTPLLSGVAYRNFSITMDETVVVMNTATQNLDAIDMTWCQSPTVENVHIANFLKNGVFFIGCSSARVDRCRMTDGATIHTGSAIGTPLPENPDGPAGYGYAVGELGINEGLVVDSTVNERVRHGYTTSMGNPAVFAYGYPHGTIVSNSVSIDPKSAGWDTHPGPFGTTFTGCTVIGARTFAYQIRSRACTVTGCFASASLGAALWVRGGGGSYGNECRVSGFTSTDSNYTTEPTSSIDWKEFGAIVDDGDDNQFDGITVVRSGGPLLTVSTTAFWAKRGTYTNLVGHELCQLAVTKKYAVDINPDGVFGGTPHTNFSIDGLTVHSTDAKVTSLVYRRVNTVVLDLKNIIGYGHTGSSFHGPDSDANVTFGDVQGPSYREVRGPRLREDFIGTINSTVWKTTLVGSDPQCAAATPLAALGGIIRMTSGDTGGSVTGSASIALDGVALVTTVAQWQAAAGGLSAEFKISLQSASAVCVFVGFTDNITTLNMPFTIGPGNALLVNTANAVGMVYDNAATTLEWTGVGVAASVSAGMAPTATSPASAVMQRLRVNVGATGSASFAVNGVTRSSLSNAVTTTTLLSPIVAILSRTTATKFVNVDYIFVEQNAV
jgi:hypothetical protein